jgi:hypothetical protein
MNAIALKNQVPGILILMGVLAAGAVLQREFKVIPPPTPLDEKIAATEKTLAELHAERLKAMGANAKEAVKDAATTAKEAVKDAARATTAAVTPAAPTSSEVVTALPGKPNPPNPVPTDLSVFEHR